MRYYAEPKRTNYVFLMNFHESDHKFISFANDYIHFAMDHHGVQWNPYKFNEVTDEFKMQHLTIYPRLYTPNPLSYFSWKMLIATKYILGDPIDRHHRVFKELVPEGAEDKLARFVIAVNDLHSTLINKAAAPCEVLFGLATVGRLTVLFYKRGVKDAAHIAPALISGFMSKLSMVFEDEVFSRLDYCAGKIISWFEKEQNGGREKGL